MQPPGNFYWGRQLGEFQQEKGEHYRGFYFAPEMLSSRLLPVDVGILYRSAKRDKAAMLAVRPKHTLGFSIVM